MIQHTEDCDDLMTGRALRQLVDGATYEAGISQQLTGVPAAAQITLAQVYSRRDTMRAFEPAGRCDCAKLALSRNHTLLGIVRKRLRALEGARSVSGDIEALKAEELELLRKRDDLRSYIAARAAV